MSVRLLLTFDSSRREARCTTITVSPSYYGADIEARVRGGGAGVECSYDAHRKSARWGHIRSEVAVTWGRRQEEGRREEGRVVDYVGDRVGDSRPRCRSSYEARSPDMKVGGAV